ncbi:hypothetical protein HP436_14320, partial [Pseudomonas sp. CrR14]|nr:hypothetical protein [Pseudomonas sp. CrR14]
VKQLRESAVGAFISAEFLSPIEPGIELLSDHVKQKSRLSPEMKLARWNEYVLSKVDFTHTFQEKMSELSKLASSPLLPKELTDLIYEFRGIVNGNVILIGKVISSAAKELPAKYSTANDVTLFRPEWIWNQYNSQRKDSSEVVGKILKYISDYLQVNKIMNK